MYCPFTKITYIPLCVFGAASQSYLRCCLQGCSPHFAPQTLNFPFCSFESQHPELISSSIRHPIVSQLACSEIPMRINPGHGTREEGLSPCIVLALGSIPCEPPDFMSLLPRVLDPSTTDKLGVTYWWWKKPQNRRYPCPWITLWMRANQKIHLIWKACIVLFREGNIHFYYGENLHSLFFISIAPRLNWERYLRTEDPRNLSMGKKLWTLSIENTSPADIKRSFQWWSEDLYTRKDNLLCCPQLLLKNHDFHFCFSAWGSMSCNRFGTGSKQ